MATFIRCDECGDELIDGVGIVNGRYTGENHGGSKYTIEIVVSPACDMCLKCVDITGDKSSLITDDISTETKTDIEESKNVF